MLLKKKIIKTKFCIFIFKSIAAIDKLSDEEKSFDWVCI